MKIMEKLRKLRKKNQQKNKQTEENIAWPCSWDYEQVMNFNAMLYGMALERTTK